MDDNDCVKPVSENVSAVFSRCIYFILEKQNYAIILFLIKNNDFTREVLKNRYISNT
jgi:hypothetical protein